MDVSQSDTRRTYLVSSIVQPAGAYSHGVIANGFLFTCSMGPASASSNGAPLGDIRDQTRRTFENLKAILAAEGVDFTRVVKVNAFLHDLERDFAGYDEVCREFLTEPFPVRTTVGVSLKGILICIDLVAQI